LEKISKLKNDPAKIDRFSLKKHRLHPNNSLIKMSGVYTEVYTRVYTKVYTDLIKNLFVFV